MTQITSRDNPLLHKAKSVRDGKIDELIFVEGLRLCEEALVSQLQIEAVIYSDEIAEKERAKRYLANVAPVAGKMVSISEKLLASISYTKTPQGIIVLAKRPDTGELTTKTKPGPLPLLVVLHGLNNPVNVGAILRSAEAAGATGIIATTKTADPLSPKALRGAMGSAFRLPIWTGPTYEEALRWCAANDIKTVGADIKATKMHTEFDWTTPVALIVGPESEGLSAEEIRAAGDGVRIAMHGEVESLNVGVAAGILLFEAARQRAKNVTRVFKG